MDVIIFLGPDRVGKSTLISNTACHLKQAGYRVNTLHFSEVKPSHHSPIDQYINSMGEDFDTSVDYLLIDRFVPDTLFYEKNRANFPKIDESWAKTAESILLGKLPEGSRVYVVHLCMDWTEDIAKRHREEIELLYPDCTEYWIGINLEKRKTEHRMYDRFVSEYFRGEASITGLKEYRVVSRPFAYKRTVFDVTNIPVKDLN